MTSFPVTPELNRVTFDDPRALDPIAEEATLFSAASTAPNRRLMLVPS